MAECETCAGGSPPDEADSIVDLDSATGKVMLIELCDEEQFATNGAGAWVSNYRGPWLKGMASNVEDIVVHANGRSFSANFQYRVSAEYSYDGETWTTFASVILTAQTTTGAKIGAAYSDRTQFGPMIRFKVGVNDSATAKESGVLSVTIAIKLAS